MAGAKVRPFALGDATAPAPPTPLGRLERLASTLRVKGKWLLKQKKGRGARARRHLYSTDRTSHVEFYTHTHTALDSVIKIHTHTRETRSSQARLKALVRPSLSSPPGLLDTHVSIFDRTLTRRGYSASFPRGLAVHVTRQQQQLTIDAASAVRGRALGACAACAPTAARLRAPCTLASTTPAPAADEKRRVRGWLSVYSTFYLMIRDQADPPTFGCGRLHLLFCVPCPLCASFFEALAVAAVVFLRDLVPTL